MSNRVAWSRLAVAVTFLWLAVHTSCSSSSLSGKSKTDAGASGGAFGGNTGAVGGDGGATGVAGAGGTAVGGTTTSTGGSTSAACDPPVTLLCTGTKPPAALISDFSLSAGATKPVAFGAWGQSVSGGTYVYPAGATGDPCATASAYPMQESFTDGAWNISGTVGTYSGMGIWWVCNAPGSGASYAGSCLIDASAYTGISFTIWGDVAAVTLNVGTPSTVKAATDSAGNPKNCGKCTGRCMTNTSIPVTPTPTTASLTWDQLGVSEPNAIEQILFMLPDPCSYTTGSCVATPYTANVHIGTMTFTN